MGITGRFRDRLTVSRVRKHPVRLNRPWHVPRQMGITGGFRRRLTVSRVRKHAARL